MSLAKALSPPSSCASLGVRHVWRARLAIAAERNIRDEEGARLQRAIQRQEEQDSLKTIDLLRQMDESFRLQVDAARLAAEQETVVFMRQEAADELAKVQEEHEVRLEDARLEMEAAKEAVAAQTAVQMREEHEAGVAAERFAFAAKFNDLEVEVGALTAVLTHDTKYKQISHATHQLSAALLSAKATPSVTTLSTLPKLAARIGDDLLVEALAPLAVKGAAEQYAKAPTVLQLARRFRDVSSAGRVASLVPEASPGLWGHALAAITSSLTLRAAEDGQSSITFSAAEQALERGDLRAAVSAVRSLEGPPAATARGWLRAAEERLLLDQLLTVATAASTVATASLAPF